MPPRALTVCGSVVLTLMAENGIIYQQTVLDLMEKEGFRVSQPALSRWLYGQSAVNKEFPEAFARALCLNEEERHRLAMAFTYGQNETIRLENL